MQCSKITPPDVMNMLSRKMVKFFQALFLLFLLAYAPYVSAMHVKGGYIHYTYNGAGSSSGASNYTITVTIFFSCTTNGPKDNVYIGIFNAATYASVTNHQVNTTTANTVSKLSFNPCMSNPPVICYQVYTYVYTLDLADISAGYIITVQDSKRINGIVNISNSGSTGITVSATIPGIINGVDYHKNNSPDFLFKDTAIICYNGSFTYPFQATDVDGDSLSYAFGNGLDVNNANATPGSAPPSSPPYPSLSYLPGYSGAAPLGSGVTIDPASGLISGTAPSTTGEYVVAVYVKEWRSGVLMDSLKKELHIYVYNCTLAAAQLNPAYINCDNYTFTFQNEATSSNITSYSWDFGVRGITTDVSTAPTPTYTYTDTGTYILKLKVSNSLGCTDSTTSVAKVYPGFTPAFSVAGSCYQAPFRFTDNTYAKYGTVNSRAWDFGESSSSSNTAVLQNPTHQYAVAGNYTATLNVSSSVGCSGNVSKTVVANSKPGIVLPFRDTLICSIDSLPLAAQVNGSGITYSWSPSTNIINANTANPTVFPKDTTAYVVTVTQNGCIGSDSVTVNVLDFITVKITADTTICQSDSIRLNPTSYALQYLWTPGRGLSDSTIKYPKAAPLTDITYTVIANLGKCQDKTAIKIKAVPYPKAYAGSDTTICYGTNAQLYGIITGSSFAWNPSSGLSNAGTLQPIAHPVKTGYYTLTVMDTLGCPKAVSDTVIVTVIPQIKVFAGNDTAIVYGEPLQLQASASVAALNYTWSPLMGINNGNIANPIVTLYSGDSMTYQVTVNSAQGCKGTDNITVILFKTAADIFMPNAFTPNGDGVDDVFRPILVGISELNYFKVYNRWGQLVFSTTENGKGWDGTFHGQQQDAGAYVYVVQGIDYLGKKHFKKGSVVLLH